VVDDALTSAGSELRSRIENLSDELAYAPWPTLSDDDLGRIAEAVRETALGAGLFPGGAFGPRHGE
jgi:hypothetical protein